MSKLSGDMMRLSAMALDLDEHYFASAVDRHIGVLSAMYYPHRDAPPKPGQLRAGAHTDFGTMTILKPDLAPGGLQVRTKSGEWAPIRASLDSYVISIGDMMARWTNDRWVSTLHRVVNPPADARIGTERLSIGSFTSRTTTPSSSACQAAGTKGTRRISAGDRRRRSVQAVFIPGAGNGH